MSIKPLAAFKRGLQWRQSNLYISSTEKWRTWNKSPLLIQGLFILLYRVILDFVYVCQIIPTYGYMGFELNLIPLNYMLSWMILLVFIPGILYILRQESCTSSTIVTFINLLYFIPTTSYIGCKGCSIWFTVAFTVYWLFLLLFQWKVPLLRLRKLSIIQSHRIFVLLTILSALLIIGVSGYYTGFRIKTNIADVYNIRAEAANYDMPTLVSYALSMMTVVLSILIIYWIQQRKWIRAAILVFIYILYYSINAQKAVFLMLVLMLFCCFFYYQWMYRFSPCFITLGVLGAWVLFRIGILQSIFDLFVRRMMFVLSYISEQYWLFFSEHPINLFRAGIMRRMGFDAVYSADFVRVMGEYIGNPNENLNIGAIGDMYANLPVILGIIFMPLILVGCFRLLDMVSHNLSSKITIPMCFLFSLQFTGTSWSTVLLTAGYLVLCVLFYIYPMEKEIDR